VGGIPKNFSELVHAVVAPVVADYVREVRELRAKVSQLENAIKLLQVHERGRAAKELVRATEATDDDD
jgi:hypothetical protein